MPKPKIVVVPNPCSIARTQTFVKHLSLDELIENASVGDVTFWSGCPGTPGLWLANCDNIGLLLNLRLRANEMFQGECSSATVSCQNQSYELSMKSDQDDQIILTEPIQNPDTSVIIKNNEFQSALNGGLESLLWLLPKVLPELQTASYWDDLVNLFPKR